MLIALNAAIFLYQVSLDSFSRNHFVMEYAMVPSRFEPSTLFTSMFLHGGWMHLIGNMWFLWIFGDNIEDILGPGRYILFYLACGAAAAFTHLMFNSDSRVPTVGASGAIAGVMGGYIRKFPHSKIVTLIPILIFFTTMEVPAYFMLGYWFLIQVWSGVGDSARSSVGEGGVAWWAHAGGFLAGVVLVDILQKRERYSHRGDLRW